jgi:uncharacterized protein (UPF0335 family)
MAYELMKMMPLNELKNKIEKLETEKAHLNDEIKELQLAAQRRTLTLQEEINWLKGEAESLRELLEH